MNTCKSILESLFNIIEICELSYNQYFNWNMMTLQENHEI